MRQRKVKQARRLLKQMNGETNQTPQFSFTHLENYIGLSTLLTGTKPESITLTPVAYTWFIQETQRHADTLNLKLGFKDDTPMFAGVKILKKEETKIETVNSVPPIAKG